LATRLAVDLSPRLGGHVCPPNRGERSTRMLKVINRFCLCALPLLADHSRHMLSGLSFRFIL